MKTVIQTYEIFKTYDEAKEAFDAFMKLDDTLAGRILEPTKEKPGYKIQMFSNDAEIDESWLPDGQRRVYLHPVLVSELKFHPRFLDYMFKLWLEKE